MKEGEALQLKLFSVNCSVLSDPQRTESHIRVRCPLLITPEPQTRSRLKRWTVLELAMDWSILKSQGQGAVPRRPGGGSQGTVLAWQRGGLPFLEPQTLPGSEGLGRMFQHPELVEEHHIEEDQKHQTRKQMGKQQQ